MSLKRQFTLLVCLQNHKVKFCSLQMFAKCFREVLVFTIDLHLLSLSFIDFLTTFTVNGESS